MSDKNEVLYDEISPYVQLVVVRIIKLIFVLFGFPLGLNYLCLRRK